MADDFKKLKDISLKGALTVESIRVIPHASNVDFLTGTSIPSFVGLGVVGKVSDVSLDMITGRRKRRRRRK